MLSLDLDGVLADFEGHFEALFGVPPRDLPLGEVRARAARTPGFSESMPLMPDALELWSHCRPYDPQILTGLARGTWAEGQKCWWVASYPWGGRSGDHLQGARQVSGRVAGRRPRRRHAEVRTVL